MKLKTLSLILMASLSAVACSQNEQPIIIDQAPTTSAVPETSQPAPAPSVQSANTTDTTEQAIAQVQTNAPINNLQSIKNAIMLAESQTKSYAVDFEIKGGYTGQVYEIETFDGTREHKVMVDGASGKVLSSYAEREFKRKEKPAISLIQAIEIAQKSVAGQVVDASLDREYIGLHYEVKVMANDGRPYEVVVDAKTGQILRSFVDYDD